MKQIKLSLNQNKTITTRKIMKLRKIKKINKRKIKTKVPKAPIANSDHGIKREEDKDKKNKSHFGTNPFQQIIQRLIHLREEIYKCRYGIDNPTNGSNIPLNNINNSNRNEFNPQNRNDNNNNRNIMHFHLDIPLNDSYDYSFNFSRLRERTNQKAIQNIKNKINKIRFNKSVSSNESSECCSICCEDFKNNQNVYSLPCHHLFHVHCLNKEIKFRQKCPMCRIEL